MKRIVSVLLLAALLAGCCRLPRPRAFTAEPQSASPVRTGAAVTASPDATHASPRTAPSVYTRPPSTATPGLSGGRELLDAFREIAFASEYPADSSEPGLIRKWVDPVRLSVHGRPTAEDGEALRRAMDGLNALEGFPGISIAEKNANADIWFVKLEEMDDVIPSYVEGNWGFFTVSFDGGRMTSAAIAIATDVTDQPARTHLIYEELLQSTGLMQDQYTRPESIFYGEWTTTPEPAAMDWELLRMLYMPAIKPGMSENEAMTVLEELDS